MDGSTERQVFCFSNLDKPPYMITSTLPQRLAKIRHIHLFYREIKSHVPPTEFNPKWTVDRKCSTCNFCHWLESIPKFMTALQTIEISLNFPGVTCPYPSLSHAWVVRLLQLQQRSKAVIKVVMIPNIEQHHHRVLLPILPQTEASMLKLQKELTRLRESKDAVIDISET
jgi:hypothetical protein